MLNEQTGENNSCYGEHSSGRKRIKGSGREHSRGLNFSMHRRNVWSCDRSIMAVIIRRQRSGMNI